MRRCWPFALLLILASCGPGVTEIVLIIDIDIPEAASLEVEASWGERLRRSTADLTLQPTPRRLVLVSEDDSPVTVALRITAEDRLGVPLVSVRREVTFEPEVSLALQVTLTQACVTAMCPDPELCGNDGACRSVFVAPCEYVGRSCDAGVGGSRDGAVSDPCPGVCGLERGVLPGDLVAPTVCGAPPDYELVLRGPAGPVMRRDDGSFMLPTPGFYRIRVLGPPGECAERELGLELPRPSGPSSPMPGATAPTDLAARVDTAFVAGVDGPFAVTTDAWFDLSDMASGEVFERPMRSVAVVDGVPYFGPLTDQGRVYRFDTAVPVLSDAFVTGIELGSGSRLIRALASGREGRGVLAIAGGAVTVVDQLDRERPRVTDLSPAYSPDRWIAVGEREALGVGRIWAGGVDQLVNRALGEGSSFGGDAIVSAGTAGDLRAAAVWDAAETIDLWLCRAEAVERYALSDADYTAEVELPLPTTSVSMACLDIALDAAGDVWVAAGSEGLTRLAPDGTRRATLRPGTAFPEESTIDFVHTVGADAQRQVWALSARTRMAFMLRTGGL